MKSSSGFSQFGGNAGFGIFGNASGFVNNSSASMARSEWAEMMLTSYQALNGALSGPLQVELLSRFEADYMWDTFGFGMGGQEKLVADFIYLLTIDGDVTSRNIIKTGDIIRWDIDGTIYNQDDLPDHVLGAGDGVVTFTSTDVWAGITMFILNDNNFTGQLPVFNFVNTTDFQIGDNGFTVNINISNFAAIITFITNANPAVTSITNPVSSALFSTYNANTCNLTGTLNLSGLTGLGGEFRVFANPLLTQIVNPVSSQAFTGYYIFDCNITGTLDLSTLTGLGGNIQGSGNPLLTQITNPISVEIIASYIFNNCNITGVLDISMLTGLGGEFRVIGNANLTSITNPSSSEVFTGYYAFNCNLTGTLDVSMLSGLGGDFWVYSNPLLTAIENPASSQVFLNYLAHDCAIPYIDFTPLSNLTDVNDCSIQIENNGMLAAGVNQILVELDSISSGGFTGRLINIAGTNAAPDLTSGGYNGVAAVASLTLKGFTVTVT